MYVYIRGWLYIYRTYVYDVYYSEEFVGRRTRRTYTYNTQTYIHNKHELVVHLLGGEGGREGVESTMKREGNTIGIRGDTFLFGGKPQYRISYWVVSGRRDGVEWVGWREGVSQYLAADEVVTPRPPLPPFLPSHGRQETIPNQLLPKGVKYTRYNAFDALLSPFIQTHSFLPPYPPSSHSSFLPSFLPSFLRSFAASSFAAVVSFYPPS